MTNLRAIIQYYQPTTNGLGICWPTAIIFRLESRDKNASTQRHIANVIIIIYCKRPSVERQRARKPAIGVLAKRGPPPPPPVVRCLLAPFRALPVIYDPFTVFGGGGGGVYCVCIAAQEEESYKWQSVGRSVGGWRRRRGVRLRCRRRGRRQSRLDGPFAPVRHDPMAPRIGLHTCTHDAYNNNNNIIFAKTPPPHVNVIIMSADADANFPVPLSLALISLSLSHSISIFPSRAHVLNIYIIRSLFIIYLRKRLPLYNIYIYIYMRSIRTSILHVTRVGVRMCGCDVCVCVGAPYYKPPSRKGRFPFLTISLLTTRYILHTRMPPI